MIKTLSIISPPSGYLLHQTVWPKPFHLLFFLSPLGNGSYLLGIWIQGSYSLIFPPLKPLQMNDNPPFTPTHLRKRRYYLDCFHSPEGKNLHFLNDPHSTAGFAHSKSEEWRKCQKVVLVTVQHFNKGRRVFWPPPVLLLFSWRHKSWVKFYYNFPLPWSTKGIFLFSERCQLRRDSKQGGLPWRLSDKESTCQCRTHGYDPWLGKIPWRRKWQPTPLFLPGKSHGQRAWQATVHGVTKSWTQLSD